MKVLAIKLTGKHGGVALVNEDDFDLIKGHTWSNCKGYARAGTPDNKSLYMHRIIAKSKHGEFVHHINNNPLDNRKENLEITDCHKHRGSHKKFNNVEEYSGGFMQPIKQYSSVDNS